MHHVPTFVSSLRVDLEHTGGQPRVRPWLRGGQSCARIRPRILESYRGPVEAADVPFKGAPVARVAPLHSFTLGSEPVEGRMPDRPGDRARSARPKGEPPACICHAEVRS